MAEIRLLSDKSDQVLTILRDVMKTEELKLRHSLEIAKKRMAKFEKKYEVSSNTFFSEWTSEDLEGKDEEYVEWAGELKLASRLSERLTILQSIKYVA